MRVNTTLHSLYRSRAVRLASVVALAVLIPLSALGIQRLHMFSDRTSCPPAAGTASGAPVALESRAEPKSSPSAALGGGSGIKHYEYVFPDGEMDVFDMDRGHALVKHVSLPTADGVRGVAANAATHMLYVSYGGDGGSNGNGSMLEYDLVADRVLWTRHYAHGIDSMATTPNGRTIYLPDGELTANGIWYVIDAATGAETATIHGKLGPHNTIVSLNGRHVYLGGRNYNYLEADTAANYVIRKIGPLYSGVRPFTINGAETIAYTTATCLLGFQVDDITTGRVLYTVPIKGFSWNGRGPSAPSHGISLSPDEKELYVMDSPSSYVHVFDVSRIPKEPPQQVADIRVPSMAGNESNCAYDCVKDGWLQHSGDGRFVYVGDSGDVIDTSTRAVVATLRPLATTRKMLEIDWRGEAPIFTTSRSGLGYVTR